MAEAVVDVLEAVDVDVQRGNRQLLAARAREHLLDAVERQHAVGQARERVVQRLMAKLAGLLPDHPDRAIARACEHPYERRQQEAEEHAPDQDDYALQPRRQAADGWCACDIDSPDAVHLHGRVVRESMRVRAAGPADEFRPQAGVRVIERHAETVGAAEGGLHQRGDVERSQHPADDGIAALRNAAQRRALPVRRDFDDQAGDAREVDRVDAVLPVVGDRLRELRARGAVVFVSAEQRGRIAPVALQQPRDFRVIEDVRGAGGQQAVARAAVGRHRFGLTADELAKRRIGVAPSLERAEL